MSDGKRLWVGPGRDCECGNCVEFTSDGSADVVMRSHDAEEVVLYPDHAAALAKVERERDEWRQQLNKERNTRRAVEAQQSTIVEGAQDAIGEAIQERDEARRSLKLYEHQDGVACELFDHAEGLKELLREALEALSGEFEFVTRDSVVKCSECNTDEGRAGCILERIRKSVGDE